jgi:tRNA G18 (ribose-2'-O)-methylase SpoU
VSNDSNDTVFSLERKSIFLKFLEIKMEIIESPFDPRIAEFANLNGKKEKGDFFICDNEKTTVRLLESNFDVPSIFCLSKYFKKHQNLIEDRLSKGSSCYVAETSVFNQIVGFSVHQGFMALGKKQWVSEKELSFPQIYFDTIADSENVGSMIRVATAFGVNDLVFDHRTASPYLRRSVRVSMGTIFNTKIALEDDLIQTFTSSKRKEIVKICLSLPKSDSNLRAKTIPISELPVLDEFVIVVGNEADGIRPEILEASDILAYIPMQKGIDSLNVSHALAVALSKIRQFHVF